MLTHKKTKKEKIAGCLEKNIRFYLSKSSHIGQITPKLFFIKSTKLTPDSFSPSQFNWHAIPERERKRHKNAAEPVWTPTMAGGLFSIDKAFFEKLGTYDSGFDIWGGENLELSFKVREKDQKLGSQFHTI